LTDSSRGWLACNIGPWLPRTPSTACIRWRSGKTALTSDFGFRPDPAADTARTAIQLPERASLRGGNGEWFALDASDVATFKRRKFM
jgi:hypothetical protein